MKPSSANPDRSICHPTSSDAFEPEVINAPKAERLWLGARWRSVRSPVRCVQLPKPVGLKRLAVDAPARLASETLTNRSKLGQITQLHGSTSCGNRPVRRATPVRPIKSVVCARLLVARSLTIHVSIGCAWVGRTGRCPQLAQKVSTRLSGCEARSRLRNVRHFGQILSSCPFAPGSLTAVPANIRSRLSQSRHYNSSSTQQLPGHAIAGAYQLRGASKTDDRSGRSSTSR